MEMATKLCCLGEVGISGFLFGKKISSSLSLMISGSSLPVVFIFHIIASFREMAFLDGLGETINLLLLLYFDQVVGRIGAPSFMNSHLCQWSFLFMH